MLNQIYFISQKGFIEGGSTRPILIEANNDKGEIGNYVLKLFKKTHEQENFSTSKEFIASFLASEFDLSTPNSFVIEVKKNFLADLFNEEDIDINEFDFGFHFCTEFIPGCSTFNPYGPNNFLKKWDFANIFSFDFLLLNTDRDRRKPNLLLKKDDFYVIDHELTLPFYTKPGGNPSNYNKKTFYSVTNSFNVSSHIFYHFMKKEKNNLSVFDEFELNLNKISFKKIQYMFDDFNKFSILNDGINGLTDYLIWCKTNNYILNTLHKKLN